MNFGAVNFREAEHRVAFHQANELSPVRKGVYHCVPKLLPDATTSNLRLWRTFYRG